jgi:hypothetical protein
MRWSLGYSVPTTQSNRTLFPVARTWSPLCEGFLDADPMNDGAAGSEGRRPKASRGGNRGNGNVGGATGAMGIWARRARRLMVGGVIWRGRGRGPYFGRHSTLKAMMICAGSA